MADAEQALFRGPVDDDDDGFGAPQPTPSPLPSIIGDYQVVARLGGGSMADLYLARKVTNFGFVRRAVIKQVKRSRADYKELQKMLLDEARATACFDHPNLVSLFDVGESDHGIYIALEYVEGTDLRRVNAKLRQRKEALPFELACFTAAEVLRGLHHAHTAVGADGRPLEIVHRDVNPSNVLIAQSGHVKLADFGVVRMRERIQQKTEPGMVKGKYAYLAPEYIAGETCSVQTDIYAAGIMLFELLSGRECFNGATAYEVMWKIVNKGVPMHRLEREGVPEDLARIVARATSMVPERRYATAQDMSNALEAWLMRSGRHATPWVLSVFFNRHGLFPKKLEESHTPFPPRSVPAAQAKPTIRPGAPPPPEARADSHVPGGTPVEFYVERQQIVEEMSRSSEARPVDPSLTPTPQFEPMPMPMPASASSPPTESSPPRASLPSFKIPSGPTTPGLPLRPSPDFEVPILAPELTEAPTDATPARAYAVPEPVVGPPLPLNLDEEPLPSAPPMDLQSPDSMPTRPRIEDAITTRDALPPASMRGALTEGLDIDLSQPAATSPEPDGAARKVSKITQDLPELSDEPKPAPVDPNAPLRAGKLEEVPATDVLARLCGDGESGIIEFRCGLIWKRVMLVKGTPTGITSNMGMELIGEHLVKARIISREALDKALTASERSGRPLTVMLLEHGALDRPTLEEELGKNLAARLNEALEWRWGTFDFTRQPMAAAEILPKLDLAALLERAKQSRAKYESSPSGEAVPEESDEHSAQKKLKEALRVARSISRSSGKGRVDRPFRPTKPT